MPFGPREEDLRKVFTIYRPVSHFGHVCPVTNIPQPIFVPPTYRSSTQALILIGSANFENIGNVLLVLSAVAVAVAENLQES